MEDVTSHLTPAAAVQIGSVDVRRIEYRGQQVVTFAMIDKVHGRVDGTARRAFNENRDRFVDGEDAYNLCTDEIRTSIEAGIFPAKTTQAKFITRRGYLKIVKSLNDDRAWEVFDDISEETGRGSGCDGWLLKGRLQLEPSPRLGEGACEVGRKFPPTPEGLRARSRRNSSKHSADPKVRISYFWPARPISQ